MKKQENKEFKGTITITEDKYLEFNKGFKYSIKYSQQLTIIALILIILSLITNIVLINYFGKKDYLPLFEICLIIILIFEFIMKKSIKRKYKQMLLINENKFPSGEIIVNETKVIDKDKYSNKKVEFKLEEIIGLIETENLIILKLKHNVGVLIEKNSINGGTPEEFTEHILKNCKHVKHKVTYRKSLEKLYYILIMIIIILYIVLIII